MICYELHHFLDASLTAFSVVFYLRTIDSEMIIECSFLMGKTYLALIGLSIPKLKLSAALAAARMDKMLKKEITFPRSCSHFWKDSKAVLMSIQNSRKKLSIYVRNRLAEMRQKWRNCLQNSIGATFRQNKILLLKVLDASHQNGLYGTRDD